MHEMAVHAASARPRMRKETREVVTVMAKRRIWIVGLVLWFTATASGQEILSEPSQEPVRVFSESLLPANGTTLEGRPARTYWVSAEYMQAWMKGMNLPPLATTSTAGTAQASAGVLGQSSTSTLFQGPVNDNSRSGFRLSGGVGLDPERFYSLEAGYIFVGSQTASSFFNATDGSILARPFKNANTSAAQSVLVAFPGSSTGNLSINSRSGNFHSVNLNLTEKVFDTGRFRMASMIGYRLYRYDEALQMDQALTVSTGSTLPFAAGSVISTTDRFAVANIFHGIDLGLRTEFLFGDFGLEILTKLAAGRLFRTVNVSGEQTATVPGSGTSISSSGLYALSSNSGARGSADWTVMPEVGAVLNWNVRSNLTLRVGYSLLYLSAISRISDQVDTTLNTTLFPNSGSTPSGANRPAFIDTHSDLWIQSVTLGFEYRF